MFGAAGKVMMAAGAGPAPISVSSWTERTSPKDYTLYSIAWGDGTWVAVGENDGSNCYVITSTDDGVTWTERTLPGQDSGSLTMNVVVYGNGVFVAGGGTDGSNVDLYTSTDGITWTERDGVTDAFRDTRALVWDETIGLFYLNTWHQTEIWTSPNGIAWTARTMPDTYNRQARAGTSGDGTFVLLCSQDGTGMILKTSTDGITWSDQRFDMGATGNSNFSGGAYSPETGTFVLCGGSVTDSTMVLTTDDFSTYTDRDNPTHFFSQDATYGFSGSGVGMFCVVGNKYNGEAILMTSDDDGVTWTQWTNPKDEGLLAVASNGKMFIAVGDSGFSAHDPYILTSNP